MVPFRIALLQVLSGLGTRLKENERNTDLPSAFPMRQYKKKRLSCQ
jgi:hypothetical protein